MKDDKATKDKLLISAKKEFMEKGFMQSSLRNICKNAGVTTGALYFFFQDKESLFTSLVEGPLNKLYEVMNLHYEEEIMEANEGQMLREDCAEDLKAANQIIHYMYQYYDEFQLVLTKAQGSRLENCIDRFVEITEKHYRMLADKMSQQLGSPRVEDYMIHWVSHMQTDVFMHMLTHEESEDAATQHIGDIVKYLTIGWYGFFNNQRNQDR